MTGGLAARARRLRTSIGATTLAALLVASGGSASGPMGAPWTAGVSPALGAEDCAPEVEPNDDPTEATTIPPLAGPTCLTGALPSDADQDHVLLEVDAGLEGAPWRLSLTGITGTITGARFYPVTSGPGEPVAIASSPWLELATRPAEPSVAVSDVVLAPGRHVVRVLRSIAASARGAADPGWRLDLAPGTIPPIADAEPNDEASSATPLSGAFEVRGDLTGGEDHVAWTIAGSGGRWQLEAVVPPLDLIQVELRDAGGRVLERLSSDTRATLFDLALAPGTYDIRLSPGTDGSRPYILRARATDATADAEPNDEPTSALPLIDGQPVRGRLARRGDHDRYRIEVLAGDERLRDVRLLWADGESRRLCLLDAADVELQCRDGTTGVALTDLLLPPGAYTLDVGGPADPADRYLLGVVPTVAPEPGREQEPNDSPATARALDPSIVMRGRGAFHDDDIYRLELDGEPGLWQVDVEGERLVHLLWLRADGTEIGRAELDATEGHAVLSDLFLIPGNHYLAVRADDGDYRLRVTSLGPPDPDAEQEPNSEPVRAEAYRVGQRRVGRLPTTTDRDLYRFTLAAPEHLRLRLEQEPDLATRLQLETGGVRIGEVRGHAAGTTIEYDLALGPGDHLLELSPEQPGAGRYVLTTERLDPFVLEADQEPNDSRGFARPLPATRAWEASAARPGDPDWYLVPPLTGPGALRIVLERGEAQVRLEDEAGAGIQLERHDDGSLVATEVPVGVPLWLEVTSQGDHAIRLEGGGLESRAAPTALALAMELAGPGAPVAAHWPEAQVLDGRLDLRNDGPDDLDLRLAWASSHHLWTLDMPQERVTLAPGEQASLPLVIHVAPDAWADEPVRISLRATTEDGSGRTAALDLAADAEAPPFTLRPGWGVPEAILGGLDVASNALGATPAETADLERELLLHDGAALGGAGFGRALDGQPLELTVDLAGERPVPVVATVIDPTARDLGLREWPRTFELLLSADGVAWQTVLTGELSTHPGPQAFELAEPVPATHARLRITDVHGDALDYVALGEWQVIAAPGATPDPMPADIADPVRGGHVVRQQPAAPNPETARGMLDPDLRRDVLDLREERTFEVVLGFQDGRAAQVTGMAWHDPEGSDPGSRLAAVTVEVSTASPLGPWQPVADWPLERGADGAVAPLALPEPTWARYVRISGDPVEGSPRVELPARIEVLERATDDDYRSILGEWGTGSANGPYEWLQQQATTGPDPMTDTADAADTAVEASPLAAGEVATDRVRIDEDEDWFAVDVPEGQHSLEVEVRGRPSVGVKVILVDGAGEARPMAFLPGDDGSVRYAASVTPGERVWLQVAQPPFSAVFAFDTSGSIGPFLDLVLEGIRSFAADLEPGRESVIVLPFEARPLLPDFSDDPLAVQAAVNAFVGTTDSSAAEQALIDAADLLADREGARAVLLLTDAFTSSFDRSNELWARLEEVRPAIFAVHVGGGDDPAASRHLMQDWAASAAGHYTAPRTAGELDRAFGRMAAWLRRPADYSLVYRTSAEVLSPGSIAVRPPEDGSRPAVAPGVGVEIILDTSGSMREKLGRRRRIDLAKESLTALVRDALPDGLPVAMRTFGGKGKSKAARCETTLALPLTPLDREAAITLIERLEARKGTATPLGAALEAVAEDLAGVTGPRAIVLVTDGAETCDGDPDAAVRALREGGLDVHVNIVGFALEDEALKESMRTWAAAGAGSYFDAADAESLTTSIAAAVNAPFRIIGPTGEVIDGGTVGGTGVALAPGTYRVEVLVDPVVDFGEVVVGSAEDVVLVLPTPDPGS